MSYTVTHLQDFLRSGGTLTELKEMYAIKTRSHRAYPNLIHFKYDQLESPFAEDIVQECRGIILDQDNNWSIVSRAFNKFFNHGEGHAATIDWNTARVQEKLDGSLCMLYNYDGKWNVATTGTPDGFGDVGPNKDLTFSEYFFQTYRETAGEDFCGDINFCYYLELMGPLNRIVVAHKKAHVALLGARNLDSQIEIPAREAVMHLSQGSFGLSLDEIEVAKSGGLHSCPVVREFPLTSIAEITKSFDAIDPTCQEGYVVVDANFNRIKIKHPGYVALHHMLSTFSTKAFVEIARSGEISEVGTVFPEYKPMLDEAKSRLEALIASSEEEYLKFKDIKDQKDFALAVKHLPYSSIFFSIRAKKIDSMRQGFKTMRIDNLLILLGYKEDKRISIGDSE
jgi:hypothetical protein